MSTYDLTTTAPATLKPGDILNCPYSGAAVPVTLPPGLYQLECWGAQGGTYGSYAGGKGGYSAGELLLKQATDVILYAGGAGSATTSSGVAQGGGFNGGGNATTTSTSYPGCGGGGASDVRLRTDSLYARVIVAGGGGGAFGATSGYGIGGAGGGESGGAGASTSTSYTTGKGGSQTGPGASYYNTTLVTASNESSYGTMATFGAGGSRKTSSSYGSAGGGGWYGGGFARRAGGGGGSGFVWTGANAPDGFLLTAADNLENASTAAGDTSFLSPAGASETGHAGDGYIRITVLACLLPPENFHQTAQDYFSIGLAWDASEGALGYKLYRDGALIATPTGTAYTDTSVLAYSTYHYTLVAYNTDGDSDPAALTAQTTQGYAIRRLDIKAASITPNPTDINTKAVLAVTAAEETVVLRPTWPYCGTIVCGQTCIYRGGE